MTEYPDTEFEPDVGGRQVRHIPSGIEFYFYSYVTEKDWQVAIPVIMTDNSDWKGDRRSLIMAAKRAAIAAGMNAGLIARANR